MTLAIMHEPHEVAWEFWPDLLLRRPNDVYVWGGDARTIDAANEPHFSGLEGSR